LRRGEVTAEHVAFGALSGDFEVLLWLEAQNTSVIALIVFAFCYLLAIAMLMIGAVLSAHPIAGKVNATTPAMLTPLGVITGLLIAFLAARVWSNVDRAQAYVAQEASDIREAALLAASLPTDLSAAIRDDIKVYLRFIDQDDWPAMLEGRASLEHPPPGLPEALTTLLSYEPQHVGQRVAQQDIAHAIERALQVRRSRILLSEAAISPPQWIAIILLDALILLTIAMLHVGRHATTAINLFVFSTAVATCLVILMINDRPFTTGGVVVQPGPLHEVEQP
jgi:hypothetical protein